MIKPASNILRISFLAVFVLYAIGVSAQSSAYTSFSGEHGLPSNQAYRCVEDDKGFLWIATDAGIARFDGKNFQVFTTEHGLPDNEVLSVAKERNGRIWVNCFRHSPAYFDEQQNRFINASEDEKLARVSGTHVMNMFPLPEGGIMYHNETGSYIFRGDSVIETTFRKDNVYFFIKYNRNGSFLHCNARIGYAAIFFRENGKDIDSLILRLPVQALVVPFINDNKFYLFAGAIQKVYMFTPMSETKLSFRVDSFKVPEAFKHSDFTGDLFYILGQSGKIYVYNKRSLQLQKTIEGDFLSNSYYRDRSGNDWLSTIDKGVLLFRKTSFEHVALPESFQRKNFLSVSRKQDGALLAGNYYGEIVEIKGAKFIIHDVIKGQTARQRKILVHGNKVFTFSDLGTYQDFKIPVIHSATKLPYAAKTGIVLNDTTILIGFSGGILKMDPRDRTYKRLMEVAKRITAMVRLNDSTAYFGSTDGVYKCYPYSSRVVALSGKNGIPSHRVTGMTITPDGLLWISTGGQGIFIARNDSVIHNITTKDGILDNTIRCVAIGSNGSAWLGTPHGVSVVRYRISDGKLVVRCENLTTKDGLAHNEINEFFLDKDTMYIATANGITAIPESISVPASNIPVYVTSIKSNDRVLHISNSYSLPSDEKNITVTFSGVDLRGRFKELQYNLDEQSTWTVSNENTLNFQFSPGSHTLQVRAVDVNGSVSDHALTLKFHIATPFWKTTWFIIASLLFLNLALAYLFFTWMKKKKRLRVAKDLAGIQTASLEQQAFTSLMNPHFIFNALNSVQHYINIQDRQNANRYLSDFASLIRKNFDAAQRSFIPLEEELECIRIYLRLEQMRFRDRFSYTIELDENLESSEWMIPTMMIQPLLENAILHGLMPLSGDGKLRLRISVENEKLLITVVDNGIGMDRSRELRKHKGHKSSSIDLIRKRLSALDNIVSEPISITTSAAFDSRTNPGNKVVISLPSNLYTSWQRAQRHGMPTL